MLLLKNKVHKKIIAERLKQAVKVHQNTNLVRLEDIANSIVIDNKKMLIGRLKDALNGKTITAKTLIPLLNFLQIPVEEFLADENLAVSDNSWLNELIVWADEKKIPEYKFPRNKEALWNLTSLDLSYNHLGELPESIGNLMNLTSLDLSYNQLSELPESIGNLTNLTSLDLFGNADELPQSVSNVIEKLELLDVQVF